jgi:hypothetical protein
VRRNGRRRTICYWVYWVELDRFVFADSGSIRSWIECNRIWYVDPSIEIVRFAFSVKYSGYVLFYCILADPFISLDADSRPATIRTSFRPAKQLQRRPASVCHVRILSNLSHCLLIYLYLAGQSVIHLIIHPHLLHQ